MDEHRHTQEIPSPEMLDALAELYKLFGDRTRLKILFTLFDRERGVGDIAQQVGYENQSKFSKVFRDHFQVLPTAYRREHGGYPDKKPGDR